MVDTGRIRASARYWSRSARPRLSAARRRIGSRRRPLGQRRPIAPPAARTDPGEGLIEQVPVLEARAGVLARHHGEVDVAARDQAHALARVCVVTISKPHGRLPVEQVPEDRRQERLAEVVAGRDAERGRGVSGQLGELGERRLAPDPELPHDRERRLAGGAQAEAAAGALEELGCRSEPRAAGSAGSPPTR